MSMRFIKSTICMCLLVVLVACGSNFSQRNNAGNRQYTDGNYDAAQREYQSAQVSAFDRPEAYFNAALAFAGAGDFEQAESALLQALTTADDELLVDIYYNLGNVYYDTGEYGAAIDFYQRVLLSDADHGDARYNLELALLYYIPPTPMDIQQRIEPEAGFTDPTVTPTNNPGGYDGPTPTPPIVDFDLSATPVTGEGSGGDNDSSTPVPRSEGEMTIEEAEQLLNQIQQDQQVLQEYLQEEDSSGDIFEKDW
jgi:tetratricopeptide (TPR) repeat protein